MRWIIGVLFLAVFGGAATAYVALKKELSPQEDRGFFLSWILAPEGASMEYTDGNVREVERLYGDIPEIVNTFAVVAPGLEPPNPGQPRHHVQPAEALGGAHAHDAGHHRRSCAPSSSRSCRA